MKLNDFPFTTEKFLRDLSKNNSKDWFIKNKHRFENEFLAPASDFVVKLGESIKQIAPNLVAIPKIDQSIFRLHRDVRFSKDKKPYKTNLGIYLWEGERPRMECPGFYFHIEPGLIFLGSGIYKFTSEQIKLFRDTISNIDKASELDEIIKHITSNPKYKIGGSELKKTPKEYDKNYEYKKFYLYKGLYSYYEGSFPKDMMKKNVLEFSVKVFRDFNILHRWLVDNL
jgi:uncharacterized protein (TIGR02453 family)